MKRRRALLWSAAVFCLLMITADALVLQRRRRYLDEIARLRASMSELERQRTDATLSAEHNRMATAVELLRRQAHLDAGLHLAVSVDSGVMYLERDGARLRRMRVEIGPERRVGTAPDTVRLAPPRGLRTVVGLVSDSTPWTVPAWVYTDRGVAQPETRAIPGGLGPAAILLDGGTVIYAMPTLGPLNDSGYVLPGSVRAGAKDLRAILPNLTAGTRVFFY
jgi:hypothetical protein